MICVALLESLTRAIVCPSHVLVEQWSSSGVMVEWWSGLVVCTLPGRVEAAGQSPALPHPVLTPYTPRGRAAGEA